MGWIFGYGSLMWRPGFRFEERREARLYGYHRAFCVYSHVHRGTPERPGLVLGLTRGGSCRGMAYRVSDSVWAATIDYLRAREQATAVYLERELPVALEGGTRVQATTYLVDRTHHQYAGRLSLEEQLRLVRQGVGQSGPNPDYVESTVRHLEDMGIVEGPLHDLMAHLTGPPKT
jgi:cation transport protein ChaC